MATLTAKPSALLLTRREAADMLGTSERTLFSLTKEGKIPHCRISQRGVRYSVKALEDWIERSQTQS